MKQEKPGPKEEKIKDLKIKEEESYAANCIWVNGWVLVPAVKQSP